MKKRVGGWIRRNLLNVAVALSSITTALAVYSVVEVTHERNASIVRNCQTQNHNHTAAITELNKEMAVPLAMASPAKRAQLKMSEGFTVLLIDALASYQNCQHVLAKSTSTH